MSSLWVDICDAFFSISVFSSFDHLIIFFLLRLDLLDHQVSSPGKVIALPGSRLAPTALGET